MSDIAANSISKALDADAFLRLFVTQLQNQNPDDPMDPSALMSQLSQLTTVQKMTQLNENFTSALRVEQLNMAVGLIGRQVYWTDDGQTYTGVVDAATESDGTLGVTVGDTFIALDDLNAVSTPVTTETE